MKHPLRAEFEKKLRQELWKLIKEGFDVLSPSKLIFVCGGCGENTLRYKFRSVFKDLFKNFIYFEPEFSIKSITNNINNERLDLSAFETLIANLSFAVIIFPEAPGSYAELGYFSTCDKIVSKTLVVLNERYQGMSSFIASGPIKKIDSMSIFGASIQLDYSCPRFEMIADRINSLSKKTVLLTELIVDKFAKLDRYHLFCLTYLVIWIHGVATLEDVFAFFRSEFGIRTKTKVIAQIIAILEGAELIKVVSPYQHYTCITPLEKVLSIKKGYKEKYNELLINVSRICLTSSKDFVDIYGKQRNVS